MKSHYRQILHAMLHYNNHVMRCDSCSNPDSVEPSPRGMYFHRMLLEAMQAWQKRQQITKPSAED